jgi:16S rRNA (guanine(527)-N(7))-methyltransferase RsmG
MRLIKLYQISQHQVDGTNWQNVANLAPFNEQRLTLLQSYAELISRWTQKIDLVSDSNQDTILEEHILDSLLTGAILKHFHFKNDNTHHLLDIGSGAGFPGVVLAIQYPELSVTLLEPREKRVNFLKEVKRTLKLDNVQVVHGRYQSAEFNSPTLYISRALGGENELYTWWNENKVDNSTLSWMVGPSWRENSFFQKLLKTLPLNIFQYRAETLGERAIILVK